MSLIKILFTVFLFACLFVLMLPATPEAMLPSQQIEAPRPHDRPSIRTSLGNEHFEVLIIGGGASGAGIALDAANRGLKVALVERYDFAAGTSAKSTKLAHGGVRYLEKAVKNLDFDQYKLVREALHERGNFFKLAPFLVKPLQIITPLYRPWEVPYMWAGLKLYDWIAGSASLHQSQYLSPGEVHAQLPQLKEEGLVGGVSFYDGQFNDSRLNISLILSAISRGATVLNYSEVTSLLNQHRDDSLSGAEVIDRLTGESYIINADLVINAAGPYVDAIRRMDDPAVKPLIAASSGTHLILQGDLLPNKAGILIPKTKDGRVIFMLPWQNATLVGTTDNPVELSNQPLPTKEEVDYLLAYVSEYLEVSSEQLRVKSAWTGIRPLVSSQGIADTASLVRDHYLEVSDHGLVTITGGKWTTFRKMAQDTVDKVEELLEREVSYVGSTAQLCLVGSSGYTVSLAAQLAAEYQLPLLCTEHLVSAYGGRAGDLLAFGKAENLNQFLHPDHPLLLSEVHWAIQHEYAVKPLDILARRTRLATLDAEAALSVLPRVVEVLAAKLQWNRTETEKEESVAKVELLAMRGNI